MACAVALAAPVPARAQAAGGDKPLRKVRLRLHWYPGGEHAYLYYGQELGLFRKAGLDVSISGGRGSSLAVKLIGGGSEDAGLVSADYVLLGLAQGLETRSVLAIYRNNPVTIYSLADKNIKTLQDLYGKRLGVMLESNTYPQWKGLCEKENIDRSKIKEIPVAGDAALGMLLRGEIDAHTYYTINGPLVLRQKGYKVNEIRAVDHGLDLYGTALVVGPSLWNDRDAVRRLRDAVAESLRRARANPRAAIEALQREVKLDDPAVELAKLEQLLDWAFDGTDKAHGVGYQSPEGWKKTAETLHAIGQLQDVSVYERAYWRE